MTGLAIVIAFVFEIALVYFDNYWHVKEGGGRWVMR